ncbi:MAG: STAS domain-containing protein [candidate division Zixibacteria bacterium]|nr:STAS domain-containing protein [candidate division Zixibacteria bacterium]
MFAVQTDSTGVIKLIGRLDAAQSANAEKALAELQGNVTVSMRELEYISSAGLGLFIATHQRLAKSGGTLTLVDLSDHVRHVFHLARLDLVLSIK